MLLRLACAAPATVLLTTLMMPSTWAQEIAPPGRLSVPAHSISASQPAMVAPMPIGPQPAEAVAPVIQPGYVHLGAPLYPAPRTNIPPHVGMTIITSPALAPHEFLYPHTYRATFPPYYHRVKGGYIWTPFGMRSHEKWELQGTEVTVKYRSEFPVLKPFHPPFNPPGKAW
ncbi:MAG TPA: hypothetical protein VFG20_01975 [Planctomycetaceae bacterium]|nr:hypothetical protein [Planctomycetaceae bacterium]